MFNLAVAAAGISTPGVTSTLSPLQAQQWRLRMRTQSPTQFKTMKQQQQQQLVVASSNPPVVEGERVSEGNSNRITKKWAFFLDVNTILHKESRISLRSFAYWISLFFSQVCQNHPVIAVIDGEGAYENRKQILPSYKAHRMRFTRRVSGRLTQPPIERSHQIVTNFLRDCNVPVLKVKGQEADDVIATLTEQVLDRGRRVVIASRDKDFKQLISEDVQLVIPLPELERWSFYTSKHYVAQYGLDPQSDLSLRCMLGDEADGVPGIRNLAPDFGRKIALKLLKKHGSLENLLNTAAVRTVGVPYVQDALTKYAYELRRNYQVLALKRDIDVQVEDEWLSKRDTTNDSVALTNLYKLIGER